MRVNVLATLPSTVTGRNRHLDSGYSYLQKMAHTFRKLTSTTELYKIRLNFRFVLRPVFHSVDDLLRCISSIISMDQKQLTRSSSFAAYIIPSCVSYFNPKRIAQTAFWLLCNLHARVFDL